MESKWNRKGRKKLWVYISLDLYEELERSANIRNVTFSKYINRALLRYTLEQNKYEDKQINVNKVDSEEI